MAGRFQTETIFKGIDNMTGPIAKIQARTLSMTRGLTKQFDGISKTMSSFTDSMKRVGAVTVGVGAAAGYGLAALSQTGLDFEKTLASIRATASPTNEQLKQISDTALKVGADFGFSATSVATAMEAMGKQGLSVQQTLAGIGGVAAAAAADGSTLEDTMGGLLSTMTTMGLKSDSLQHIADVMAKAGDSTAASIGSLSESMAIFGVKAKDLGIPLESAIGQLAILQDAGIDASSAGTTLTAVYSKLSAPFGRTGEAIKKLGLDVADSFGNMKPPDQLMNEILGAVGKIQGNVGKAGAITELVGLGSQKALANLMASVESGKFDKVMSSLTNGVDGYAMTVAKIKQDSAAGDIAKMAAAFEALKISLFGIASGPLRAVTQGIAAFMSQRTDGLVAGFGRLVERATPLVKLFSESFLETMNAISEGFAMLFPPTDDGKQWNVLLTGLARNLGQLAAVAAGIVAGVAGVTAGIVLVGSIAVSTIKGAFDGLVAFFGERIFAITDWFANLGAMFDAEGRGFFEKAWNIGKHIVTGLIGGIKSIATAPFDLMQSIGKSALAGLKAALGIASPSREMAALGRFTSAGFTDGILAGLPAVQGAFSDLIRLPEPIWTGPPEPADSGPATMVTPQERAAYAFSETSSTTRTEVTLRAEPGTQARQTGGPKRAPGLKLEPTGAL